MFVSVIVLFCCLARRQPLSTRVGSSAASDVYKGQPDVIRHAVWLYARFTLSFRDVEDLLAERGLDISYETVRRWFLKFGVPIARNLRHMRPTPSDYWHLDEMVIVIRGCRHWL